MKKKIVLITGGNSKLGIPLAQQLSEKGFIVYAGMRDIKKAPWSKTQNIVPIKLDITSDLECKRVINKITKSQGQINYLVNNAAITITGPTVEFSSIDYLKVLDVNAVGAFRVIKAAIPLMKKQKGGRIINISSLNGLVALPNFGIYSSSKFALEGLTSAFRIELKKNNIWLTSIAPGAIESPAKREPVKLPHKPLRERFKILKYILKMTTQDQVIQKIINVMEASSPPARVVIGQDAVITFSLYRYLPNFLWDKLNSLLWKS